MSTITETAEWKTLSAYAAEPKTLSALFDDDPERASRYCIEGAGLVMDFSRQRIDPQSHRGLIELAKRADIEGARERMLTGEAINVTEGRAVLHPALRDFAHRSYHVDGKNISQDVENVRNAMRQFCATIHNGEHLGCTGKPLTTIVNIGIGGSDLGPAMAVEALRPYWIKGRASHFVSNIDGQHLSDVLEEIDPETALFIIASKTFTTQETMTNAKSARDWLLAQLPEGCNKELAIRQHFIALSTNERAVTDFGIASEHMFGFWDWVGGRYSLWSAIGLSIALQTGFDHFERLLRGAHAMDEHFRSAAIKDNLPMMLALVGVWNRNFLNIASHAVLPYDQHLARFPAYLQQADMESNGKSTTLAGNRTTMKTGPIIFGEPGTNGQHAFYQLIHQGTDIVSTDFIAPANSHSPLGDHHQKLLANFLAQPRALMLGKSRERVEQDLKKEELTKKEIDRLAPHKEFTGNRPSTLILMELLTPETLGALIALYEHKIFCQGVIWGINSFDQWGVELGKVLAKTILPLIDQSGEDVGKADIDSATMNLLLKINKMRDQ